MISLIRLLTAISLTVVLFTSGQAAARTNMLFILDASNSMWGQVEGKSKISSAQEVLGTLLTDLPADTSIGLMTYGHRDKASCTDIELLSPIGTDKPDSLTTKINGIQPKGKTPIAAALKSSVDAFAKNEGENNHVVLISDGLESCDGDPCAAAGLLASANIKARVHVVGFDVGADERKKLECIPEMGNGKYFSAANAAELKLAVAEVKKEAVKPPPAPPVAKEYFRDDFDGTELAEHWEVLHPNPDAFIVEDGKLVIINSMVANITDDKIENTFRLTSALPEGDWDAIVKLIPEVQTFQERMTLSYMKDAKNQLAAILDVAVGLSWSTPFTQMRGEKHSNGKVASFDRITLQGPQTGVNKETMLAEQLKWFKNNTRAIYLKIAKRGRSYVVSSMIEGDATTMEGKKPEWATVQQLTSLRPPGTNLALTFMQRAASSGESIISIDWVKIEIPQ